MKKLFLSFLILSGCNNIVTQNNPVETEPKIVASFDCSDSEKLLSHEKIICSDKKLADKDIQLSNWYATAMNSTVNADELKKSQKEWIKKTQNKTKANELSSDYSERISELKIIAAGCDKIKNIDWQDKQDTINRYKSCIGYSDIPVLNFENKNTYDTVWELQTDSKLFLSYIYFMPGKYNDNKKANELLNSAISEMGKDCDKAHGTYDNFCYMEYFNDKIPKKFENISDAMNVYHMSMPYVYLDMIKENKKALELIEPAFGSSRDINIPRVLDDSEIELYFFKPFNEFEKIEDYKTISDLNTEPMEDGTFRFLLYRNNYINVIKLAIFPNDVLKEFESTDVSIPAVSISNDPSVKKVRFYASDIESKIYKSILLKEKYNDIILNIEKYYTDSLGMPEKQAKEYSKKAAQLILLHNIFNI